MKRVLICIGIAGWVSLAGAAVEPIAPFIGEGSEGFESIIPPGPYSGPMPIFEGAGTIDDYYTDPWIAWSLFGSGYEMYPYEGGNMGLTPTGWTVFTFDPPVRQFGGYFGTVNDVSGGTATFYDAGGALIEVEAFDIPQAHWTWSGWYSDVPFASLVVQTNMYPGATGVYDAMQLSYVPEPGALALLVGGVALLLRRR